MPKLLFSLWGAGIVLLGASFLPGSISTGPILGPKPQPPIVSDSRALPAAQEETAPLENLTKKDLLRVKSPSQMRVALLLSPGPISQLNAAPRKTWDPEAALKRCQALDFSLEPHPDMNPHQEPPGMHYRDLGFIALDELASPYREALMSTSARKTACALVDTSAGVAIVLNVMAYQAEDLGKEDLARYAQHIAKNRARNHLRSHTIADKMVQNGFKPDRLISPEEKDRTERILIAGECAVPCYCNGHIENMFLFGLDPIFIADLLNSLIAQSIKSRLS